MLKCKKRLVVLFMLTLLSACEAKGDDNTEDKETSSTVSSKRPPPSSTPEAPLSSSPVTRVLCAKFTVKTGDTASSVAAAANVDYEALIAALQQCIGYIEGDFLTVGENICLPPYSTSCRYVSPAGQDENCKVYNVQQGDTMASIAASFNIDLAAFQEINQDVAAPERPVRPGQRLRLPPWGSDCPELTAMLTSCQVYAARSGDTLSSIASVFRTTVEEIVAVNAGMSPIGVLSPGQPVKIPPFPAACRAGNLVTGPSNEGVTVCRAYQVQVGDSIDSIAGDFGLNTDDVVDLNRELEDAAKVTPGIIIKLPPWEENCPVEGLLVSSPSSMNTSSSSALEESNSTSSRPPPAPTPSASPMPININPAGTPRIPGPVPGPDLPAAVAAPTPAPAVIVPLNSLEVEVVVLGTTIAGLEKTKASLLIALTSAAHVPSSNVSVIEVKTPSVPYNAVFPGKLARRRLLDTETDAITIVFIIVGDIDAIHANLQKTEELYSLSLDLEAEGLQLSSLVILNSMTGKRTMVYPLSSTVPLSSSKTSIPVPFIVGGTAGGIFLIALIVGCTMRIRRRQSQEANAKAPVMPRLPGVSVYVTKATDYKGAKHGDAGSKYKTSSAKSSETATCSIDVHAFARHDFEAPKPVDIMLPNAVGSGQVNVCVPCAPTVHTTAALAPVSQSMDAFREPHSETSNGAQQDQFMMCNRQSCHKKPPIPPLKFAGLTVGGGSLPSPYTLTRTAQAQDIFFTPRSDVNSLDNGPQDDVGNEQQSRLSGQPMPVSMEANTSHPELTMPAALASSLTRSPARSITAYSAHDDAVSTSASPVRLRTPSRPLPRVAILASNGHSNRSGHSSPTRTPTKASQQAKLSPRMAGRQTSGTGEVKGPASNRTITPEWQVRSRSPSPQRLHIGSRNASPERRPVDRSTTLPLQPPGLTSPRQRQPAPCPVSIKQEETVRSVLPQPQRATDAVNVAVALYPTQPAVSKEQHKQAVPAGSQQFALSARSPPQHLPLRRTDTAGTRASQPTSPSRLSSSYISSATESFDVRNQRKSIGDVRHAVTQTQQAVGISSMPPGSLQLNVSQGKSRNAHSTLASSLEV